jgi:hypothetical protein
MNEITALTAQLNAANLYRKARYWVEMGDRARALFYQKHGARWSALARRWMGVW